MTNKNETPPRHMISMKGDKHYERLKREASIRGISIGEVIEDYIAEFDKDKFTRLKQIHTEMRIEYSRLKGEAYESEQTKALFDVMWYIIYNLVIGVIEEKDVLKLLRDNMNAVRTENNPD